MASARLEIEDLENQSADPDFWLDLDKSQKVLQKIKNLKAKVSRYDGLMTLWDDIETLIALGNEENDGAIVSEVQEMAEKFTQEYHALHISTLLDGEYDNNNAIVTLHAGAGGTEACDWVSMLFRMYVKWAERQGFATETLDYLEGEEAGIKSVTFQVTGENAFGYLKAEKGVHRLVRISPFDSSGRRHTSFASCDVMPEIDDDVSVTINMDDVRVDTYRASGAGGQHVNKTSSAIRLTHVPTGIVVTCQNERSQFSNKDTAFKMLRSKLLQLKMEEQLQKLSEIRGDIKEIGWGSQIRSYVFMPYTMVKDHRTNEETGNIQGVMDGSIDPFMNAYLSWIHS